MAASSASTEDQAPAWVNALWIGLPFNCQTAIDWNQRKKMIILTAFDMSLAQKLFLFEVSDVYQIFNEAYGIFWCDIHYWHVTGTSMLLNKFPILLLCNKELFPPASAKGQPTFVILLRAPGVRKAWQITDFCPTWSCCQHTWHLLVADEGVMVEEEKTQSFMWYLIIAVFDICIQIQVSWNDGQVTNLLMEHELHVTTCTWETSKGWI